MDHVTVQKDELVKIITENRVQHRAIFEEAVEGYRREAVRVLEDHIARIKDGKLERVSVHLPEPSDHTADYDRVLRMLEMSVDDVIKITEEAFGNYVMDDWHWKREFLTTNSAYSATARRLQ